MKYVTEAGRLRLYSLEVHAADHCNLRCALCVQNSPYLPEGLLDPDSLERCLFRLGTVVWPKALIVLGGEPLLNPRIAEILAVARRARIADKVVLATNGLLLGRVDLEIWRLVDVIGISLYPATRSKIERMLPVWRAIADRHGVELELYDTTSFREIVLDRPDADPERVQSIYTSCIHRHFTHTLYQERFLKCSPLTHMDAYHSVIGASTRLLESDGILVDDAPDLREKLWRYLEAEVPLTACMHCRGSSGREVGHRQLTRREIALKLANTV